MAETSFAGTGPALQIEVPLTPAFSSGHASIRSSLATVTLPLVAGTSVVTTAPQVVGSVPGLANPELVASLSVWFAYDPKTRTITLCGKDLVSGDATFLSTTPAGSPQVVRQYTYSNQPSLGGNNPNWNYTGLQAPGLADALHKTVRAAQHAIINTAIASGLNVAVRTPVPVLTPPQAADLRVVYHGGVFRRAYDPAVPLEAGDVVHPIESVWGGEVTFSYAEAFANVIGSTGDPQIGGLSWIALWRNQFGTPPQCTSLSFPAGFTCTPPGTNSPLGGHVIVGQTATQVPYGVNYVYIMPICSAHNNNNNVYMEALQAQKGVWLKNYHQ